MPQACKDTHLKPQGNTIVYRGRLEAKQKQLDFIEAVPASAFLNHSIAFVGNVVDPLYKEKLEQACKMR